MYFLNYRRKYSAFLINGEILIEETVSLNMVRLEFSTNNKVVMEEIKMSAFDNATLMITGGTGSFGSTVLKHFLDSDLKEIRIFSRDEKKQDDMRHALQNSKIKYYIGNVRDKSSVDVAMNGVD